MGAWGLGIYENDAALDFVADLTQGKSVKPLRDALAEVLKDDCMPWRAEQALAAADIVARLQGNPIKSPVDAEIRAWIAGLKNPAIDRLAVDAHRALLAMQQPDATAVLELDPKDVKKWQAMVAKIAARIELPKGTAITLPKRKAAPKRRLIVARKK